MNSKKTMDYLKHLKSVIAESPERQTEKSRIWSRMATDFGFNCGSLARSSCPHLISAMRHKKYSPERHNKSRVTFECGSNGGSLQKKQ